MASLESLTKAIESQPSLERKVEALVAGLAERIKGTSNDQNIQRLAADLRRAVPDLVRALSERAGAT